MNIEKKGSLSVIFTPEVVQAMRERAALENPARYSGPLTVGDPILTSWEARKMHVKIQRPKYDWGRNQLLLAFRHREAAADPRAVGQRFDVETEGKRLPLGEIIHSFPDTGAIVVLVDRAAHAPVLATIHALRQEAESAGHLSKPDEPPTPLAQEEMCQECGVEKWRQIHFPQYNHGHIFVPPTKGEKP